MIQVLNTSHPIQMIQTVCTCGLKWKITTFIFYIFWDSVNSSMSKSNTCVEPRRSYCDWYSLKYSCWILPYNGYWILSEVKSTQLNKMNFSPIGGEAAHWEKALMARFRDATDAMIIGGCAPLLKMFRNAIRSGIVRLYVVWFLKCSLIETFLTRPWSIFLRGKTCVLPKISCLQ